MVITLREITPDEASIELVWAAEMPRWWRAVDSSVARRTHGPCTRIGVFTPDLVAIYTLQQLGPTVIDAHLSCERGTDVGVIVASAVQLKDDLLSMGFTTLYLWPLSRNRALIAIAKLCGFRPTGVKMLSGTMGNRPAEWIQLGVTQ